MPEGSAPKNPTSVRLALTTLGGWSFSYAPPERALTPVIGPSKPLALLVYLSAMPGHAARREHLADLLWADLDPDAARHALRQTLWHLRRRVGAEIIQTNGDQIALIATLDTDRDAFLAAVEQQDHDRAVAFYAGEFLPGFAAPGGAEFERWAEVERFRLRSTFLRTASALVRRRLDASQFREAVALARRVRDAEPTSEAGWRLLIEALVSAGDRGGAALEADQLGQWLAAEAREPEPKTSAVVRLVTEGDEASPRRRRNTPTAAHQLVPEFVGREPEFGAILGAWIEASRGRPRHIHITGAAGLGKTRLLAAAHARLRATGARSVLLRANPGDQRVSFAFAADFAAALAALPGAAAVSTGAADTLVGLCPTLSTCYPSAHADHGSEAELARRRGLSLGELLASIADEAPVAVLVDDAHWADPASRQLLAGVVSHLSSDRVLVVTAARPVVEGTVSHARTTTLTLEPLTVAHVSALVAGLGALPVEPWTDRFAQRLHAATGGSPLLVIETLQLALERGTLSRCDEGWRCRDGAALETMLVEGGAVSYRVAHLARDEMWLLLVLSAAGAPLGRDELVRLAARTGETLDRSLAELEHRGFVAHSDDHWAPSHDEIGAASLALAPPDALRAAHLALGRALEDDAARDATLLPRAAHHLGEAGDIPSLDRVLAEWTRRARRRKDRRPLREVLADAVGGDADRVAAAVRRMPLHVRAGLTTPGRIAAAAAVVLVPLLAGLAAVLRPVANVPDDVLVVVSRAPDGSGVEQRSVPIRRSEWSADRTLDILAAGGHVERRADADWGSGAAYSTARGAWAVTRVLPEPHSQDLFLIDADGTERQLTASPGDDVSPTWAPDGSAIAFSTARWNAQSWYDIGVLDLATGGVRQVTRGDAHDSSPIWSPDGTRIAFVRSFLSQPGVVRPSELCVVSPSGAREACFDPAGFTVAAHGGWADAGSVVAWLQDSAGGNVVALVDVDSRRVTILRSGAGSPSVSADGKWVAALLDAPRELAGATVVFPLEQPRQARVFSRGGERTGFTVLWGRAATPLPYLSRLTVPAPQAPIPTSATYRLRAIGVGPADDTLTVHDLRWWTADSTVAVVTDSGVLVPRRAGVVMVHATAGGWRSDSIRVAVGQPLFARVLTEAWSDSIEHLWRPYGRPRPSLTRGPGDVPAFSNNGDGSFASGAYSRSVFTAAGGFGVETSLSTPVTSTHWQSLAVELQAERDSSAWASWDHVIGGRPPEVSGNPVQSCLAVVPWGEGPKWARTIGVSAAGRGAPLRLPPDLTAGRWYRVRLQLFADGRCGLALDGRPIWVGNSAVPTHLPIRIHLYGNSAATRMLIGPLEAWEGVRGDVDWRVLR